MTEGERDVRGRCEVGTGACGGMGGCLSPQLLARAVAEGPDVPDLRRERGVCEGECRPRARPYLRDDEGVAQAHSHGHHPRRTLREGNAW